MTDTLAQRQARHVLFTWTAQNKAKPLHIVSAQGSRLTLVDGKQVLDFCSQAFNANLGHGHQAISEAIREASLDPRVLHPSGVHEQKALLGENLSRITPSKADEGLTKSFFCLGGAEAVENAIKIARLVTGRYKVVTRYRSYHGATLGTLSYGGDYRRIPFDGSVTGVVRIPDPYERGSGQVIDTVRLLEEIIEIEGPETIACVLLEGITGANGVFVPPQDYWKRIRELCTRYGIMLIADEVMSGFGRTGKWFGIDHFGVTPDLMTMAKGITGGYAPLGAVIMTEAVASHFDDETLWCGLSAYGNPLSCAVANAAIAAYEKDGLIANAHERGLQMKTHLEAMMQSNPCVAQVRSIGLLAAIDLQKGPQDKRPYVSYRATGEEAKKDAALQKALMDKGLYCLVRFGMVILAPPLCITKEEIDVAMAGLKEALDKGLLIS